MEQEAHNLGVVLDCKWLIFLRHACHDTQHGRQESTQLLSIFVGWGTVNPAKTVRPEKMRMSVPGRLAAGV